MLDADLLVINEIENDGFAALSTVTQLVEALNKAMPASPYRAIEWSGAQLGSAAIHNAILYRSSVFTPVGAPVSIRESSEWIDRWHRPFLTQVFETIQGNRIRVVAAHLKSKAGQCPGETAAERSQFGACVPQRQNAVQQLDTWLSELPTYPTLLLGDLNAVPEEPAMQTLFKAGWAASHDLDNGYSYVFDGTPQVLDYALMRELDGFQVIQAEYWNVNAGLPEVGSSNPWPSSVKRPDFVGFSDHNPVVLDLVE
jgi:predicted extracellular nuclease